MRITEDPFLSGAEKSRCNVLVIDSDPNERNQLRGMLQSLGYGAVSEASDHMGALRRLRERTFTHIIFTAEKTSMNSHEFVKRVLHLEPQTILIASIVATLGEQVFELLQDGAKGFLAMPCTPETLDESIASASKGEPIADSILHAPDRNRALASMVSSSLDKAALAQREVILNRKSQKDISGIMEKFKRSVKVAWTLAKGGPTEMGKGLESFLLERSNSPSTKLGRIRKRLQDRRKKKHAKE